MSEKNLFDDFSASLHDSLASSRFDASGTVAVRLTGDGPTTSFSRGVTTPIPWRASKASNGTILFMIIFNDEHYEAPTVLNPAPQRS
ncbi:hypothetical protein BV898_05860 [Hypsibius exemplaris]|uniref:Uncharacterized protein n=1 Tax=Hypsibius exemplaris TaxID=2072580 RepID=A0A1W0WXZ5_HYPEX|nr:hypothetical protein BV898_05860 [Hypsibius exemplaris]